MRTSAWFSIGLALTTLQCGGKANTKQQSSTNTTQTQCEADAECNGEKCICGYCTAPCSSDDDCGGWPGSSCRAGTTIGCSREGSLCLPTDAEGPASDAPGDSPGAAEPEPGLIPESDDDSGGPAAPEPEPEPVGPAVDVDECRTLAKSEDGLGSGSALVDRYFAEVEHVAERTQSLSREAIATFAELATQVGATTATAAGVVEAYPAWVTELTGSQPTLLMWPAHCPIATEDMNAFTQACDPDLPPGDEGLGCDGICLPSSGTTCLEGSLDCHVPSPSECGGTCEGACETPLGPGGSCDGPCAGICTVADADVCAEGEAACRSEAGSTVLCAGACEGQLEPRQTVEGCSETARAAAWLSLGCTATPPVPFASGQADAGPPAPEPMLTEFLTTGADIFAIQQQATLALQAAALLSAALPAVDAALASSDGGDAGAASACTQALASAAAATLGQAGADIGQVMTDTSTFITGIQ